MLSAERIRPSLNNGRYLFHNIALRLAVGGIDAVLEGLHPPSRSPLDATPGKILVCNQAHIGDVIWASSALPVLKAAFPAAKIGFLVHPGSAVVLAGNPRVEWVHTFEHWKLNRRDIPLWDKLVSHFQSRSRALTEIKTIGYDLAIDLYPYFPNSIPLLLAAGIPLRLGWTSGGFGGLLTHALDWGFPGEHVVEWSKRLLGQIQSCQEYTEHAQPELYSSGEIQQEWGRAVAAMRIPSQYVAFHVGVGALERRWPEGHWKALAKLCLDAGLSLVLLGHGKEEEHLCRRLADSEPAIVDLSGKLSWLLMAEAIARSVLLVGLESASSHIAAARNIPAVCIYSGISHPAVFRPYNPMARVLVHPTPCAPCHSSRRCEGMECVRMTSAESVFFEIQALLDASRR